MKICATCGTQIVPGSECRVCVQHAAEHTLKLWGIFHRDREYARVSGDPLLGRVRAVSKDMAEIVAMRQGISSPAGLWACEIEGL